MCTPIVLPIIMLIATWLLGLLAIAREFNWKKDRLVLGEITAIWTVVMLCASVILKI